MNLTALLAASVLVAVLVAVAVGLWRAVTSDGARSRRAPEHAQWHWSGAADLPDTPYRTVDRIG